MAEFNNPLNNIKIASPCSANWDEMVGSERQRYCGECKLNVYSHFGNVAPGCRKFDFKLGRSFMRKILSADRRNDFN